MTPIEFGLTVAVVVQFIGLLLLWRMAWVSRVDCANLMTKAVFARQDIDGHYSSTDKRVANLEEAASQRLTNARLQEKVSERHERELRAIESEVASLSLCVKELAAQRLPVHASHELLTAIEGKVEALQREVERHRHQLNDDEPTCLGDDPPVPLFIEQEEPEAA